MHRFVIKDKGVLTTYNKFEDIPMKFDHVIEFHPYTPPEPHTEEQHKEIEQWPSKLQELIKRER
tara:strand:+ start:3008 stop:3199 length:192 start_codon:yes stop_codon:yes gene_type:complete